MESSPKKNSYLSNRKPSSRRRDVRVIHGRPAVDRDDGSVKSFCRNSSIGSEWSQSTYSSRSSWAGRSVVSSASTRGRFASVMQSKLSLEEPTPSYRDASGQQERKEARQMKTKVPPDSRHRPSPVRSDVTESVPDLDTATPDFETTCNDLADMDLVRSMLCLVFDLDLDPNDMELPILERCQTLTADFVSNLEAVIYCTTDGFSSNGSSGTTSTSTTGLGSDGDSLSNISQKGKGKRMSDDGFSGRGSNDGDGAMPKKRRKPPKDNQTKFRLSCPYRKRNPTVFNVREHYSCSMTMFPSLAAVRQHVVSKHQRRSSFTCARCKETFSRPADLQQHLRLRASEMCEVKDFDPLDGIDSVVCTSLLRRLRAPGRSIEDQWKELWHLLFPNDIESGPYEYCPVMEHFELRDMLLDSLPRFLGSLGITGIIIGDQVRDYIHTLAADCENRSKELMYENNQSRGEGSTRLHSTPNGSESKSTEPGSESASSFLIQRELGYFSGQGALREHHGPAVAESGSRLADSLPVGLPHGDHARSADSLDPVSPSFGAIPALAVPPLTFDLNPEVLHQYPGAETVFGDLALQEVQQGYSVDGTQLATGMQRCKIAESSSAVDLHPDLAASTEFGWTQQRVNSDRQSTTGADSAVFGSDLVDWTVDETAPLVPSGSAFSFNGNSAVVSGTKPTGLSKAEFEKIMERVRVLVREEMQSGKSSSVGT